MSPLFILNAVGPDEYGMEKRMPPMIEFVWIEGRSRPLVYCTPSPEPIMGSVEKDSMKREMRRSTDNCWKRHRRFQYRTK